MANNIVIPASGTTGTPMPTVATEQIGAASAHYQLVKLVGGAAGDVTGIMGGTGAVSDSGLYGIYTMPLKRKNIATTASAVSASGDNVVMTAPGAGSSIKVFAYALQSVGAGTVTAQLLKGTAGAALSMPWQFQNREGIARQGVVPPDFFFNCGANTALVLNLNTAVQVSYEFQYWIGDAG